MITRLSNNARVRQGITTSWSSISCSKRFSSLLLFNNHARANTSKVFSRTKYSSNHWGKNDSNESFYNAFMTPLVLGSSIALLTSAQKSASLTKTSNESKKEEYGVKSKEAKTKGNEEKKEDDYSDLPEEDEPTSCSICLINRQGPCRNPWRRFERCMKQNSPSEDEDEKDDSTTSSSSSSSSLVEHCAEVSMIWMSCLEKYRVTYMQLTNKQYQPEINKLESKYKAQGKVKTFSQEDDAAVPVGPVLPRLDLSHYQAFEQARIERELDVDHPRSDGTTYDKEEKEKKEVVISGYAYFELYPSDNEIIHVAFIKDQDENLIGFDHFTHEKKSNEKEGEIIFHVPAGTTSLVVSAIYKPKEKENEEGSDKEQKKMNGTNEEEEEEELKGILYHHTISNIVQDVENYVKEIS